MGRLESSCAQDFPGSSAGIENAHNAGDPSLIPESWVRKIPWRKDRLPIPVFLDFPGGSDSKEPVFLVLVAHLFYT